MDVGYGCTISDNWIPKGVETGLKDVNGVKLITSDKVKLCGCTSRYAYVGLNMDGNFVLYFGSENGSTSWSLCQEVIHRHKIEKILYLTDKN